MLSRCELHKNMWVIPAGDIPPNPSELLGSEQMRITLDVLSRDFDYILLDLPPVTAVSDPLVVSKLMNGMLLVVRQNYATRRSVAETVRQLHTLPNPPSIMVGGAVVTPEYAQNMGAFYAKDARASVEIAKKVLG